MTEFDRRSGLLGCISALSFSIGRPGALFAASGASYVGNVVAEWLDGGRKMRLREPFEFRSAQGRRWPVPSGAVVDGASIPQIFWSLIGGPFEGVYRNASVIHDRYCDTRVRKAEDVHQMFYDAMLTSGVGRRRAWIMYQAVAQFGPQWADPKIDPKCEIVDENYDFTLCARNAQKPAVNTPDIGKDKLSIFLDNVQSQSDPQDVALLRKKVEQL
ncbi:MAG: DUF1353 domain-containing protein [Rhodoblastus sp.]